MIFVILDICFYKLLMLLSTELAFTLSTRKKKMSKKCINKLRTNALYSLVYFLYNFILNQIKSHLFPLPCGAGSTVPREGFDSGVIMPFS